MARPPEFDRDAALRQAMELFWAKGFAGTSVADLTAGMGLSRSSLYAAFGDKEALFAEALASYAGTLDRWRAELLAAEPARRAIGDYLRGVAELTTSRSHPGGCFLTISAASLASVPVRVHDRVRQADERQLLELADCLRRGQERGELPAGLDPAGIARFLGGVARGLAVLGGMGRRRSELEEVARVALTVLDRDG